MRCMINLHNYGTARKKQKRDKLQEKVSPSNTASSVPKREGMSKWSFSYYAIKWHACM